jgi:hypothetical protein
MNEIKEMKRINGESEQMDEMNRKKKQTKKRKRKRKNK